MQKHYLNARELARLAALVLERAGITQQQAAEELGVHVTAIKQAVNFDAQDPERMITLRRRVIETWSRYRIAEEPAWEIQLPVDDERLAAEERLLCITPMQVKTGTVQRLEDGKYYFITRIEEMRNEDGTRFMYPHYRVHGYEVYPREDDLLLRLK